jgi:uncharacterized protein with ParB-like and HNH nuclease domain
MRKIIILSMLLVGLTSYTFATRGHTVVDGNYSFDKTTEKTYTYNRCSKGYKKLKKLLKSEAKTYCASQGNYGMKMLAMKKWDKISCTKIKRKHHKTKVTIKGRFRAMCN